MFNNKYIVLIFGLGLLAIIFYFSSTTQDFGSKINKERQEYGISLLKMENSPIKEGDSMSYFKPNKDFIVAAEFKESRNQQTIIMTDGSKEPAQQAGFMSFKLNDKSYELVVFDEGEHYMLPFVDLSCGKETYGGGRYINIKKSELSFSKVLVDFNAAHNFYCAYTPDFVCPVPPKNNFIDVDITAGEKTFK